MAEKTRAEELHDEYRRKVWEDTKSGSENFDKYLLTFSSGALGLSLTFIKDVVPIESAVCISSLIASWFAFVLCIFVTLISFRISIQALERMVPHLNEFYLNGNVEAFNKHLEDPWTKAVDWCANLGIFFFVCGLVFTMLFVSTNIRRVKHMSERDKANISLQEGVKPVAMTPSGVTLHANDGIKPTLMTPLANEDRGLKPAVMTPMQRAPTPAPPTPSVPKK
jgi:hypothetical protein